MNRHAIRIHPGLRLLAALLLLASPEFVLGEGVPSPLPEGLKAGAEKGRFICEKDGAPMVWIEAGKFPRGNGEGEPDERPPAEVQVSGFFLDVEEVTNGRYRAFYTWWREAPETEKRKFSHRDEPEGWDHRPAFWPGEDEKEKETPDVFSRDAFPVVGVSWFSARACAKWAGKDLPTEAEWEKAASHDGASKTKRNWPWGNARPDFTRCNFAGNVGFPVRPGRYESGAARCGAVDLSGNVWEWCADYYHKDFYGTETGKASDPLNGFPSAFRAVRGGSYSSKEEEIRTTYRDRADPRKTYRDVGFRCVLRVKKAR